MDRGIPEFNRLIIDREVRKNRVRHRSRLREVGSTIDQSPPIGYNYPINKAKKEQIVEEQCNEIERTNKILLAKMTQILSGNDQGKHTSLNTSFMPPLGSVTNRSKRSVNSSQVNSSLNQGYRNRVDQEIMQSNEKMLKRLQDQKSVYDVMGWEESRKESKYRLNLISKYSPCIPDKVSFRKKRKSISSGDPMPSGHGNSLFESQDPNQMLFDLYKRSVELDTTDEEGGADTHRDHLLQGSGGSSKKQLINSKQAEGNVILPAIMQPNITNRGNETSVRNIPAVGTTDHNNNSVSEHFNNQHVTNSDFPDKPNSPFGMRKTSRTEHGGRHGAEGVNIADYPINSAKPSKREKANAIHIVAKKRPPPMDIGFNEHGIDKSRKVLYRNFHQISKKVYLVEISRNPKKIFVILFPNFEQPDIHILEVFPEKVAAKLMQDNGNLFENLIEKFYTKFGKLQIIGYHGKGQTYSQSVPPLARLQGNSSQGKLGKPGFIPANIYRNLPSAIESNPEVTPMTNTPSIRQIASAIDDNKKGQSQMMDLQQTSNGEQQQRQANSALNNNINAGSPSQMSKPSNNKQPGDSTQKMPQRLSMNEVTKKQGNIAVETGHHGNEAIQSTDTVLQKSPTHPAMGSRLSTNQATSNTQPAQIEGALRHNTGIKTVGSIDEFPIEGSDAMRLGSIKTATEKSLFENSQGSPPNGRQTPNQIQGSTSQLSVQKVNTNN